MADTTNAPDAIPADVLDLARIAREVIRQRVRNHWATEGRTEELVEQVASQREEWQALDALSAQIASLSAKLAAVEEERDAALDHDWVATPAYEKAMARASELQQQNERLREALRTMLKEHDILSGNFGDIMDPKHTKPDRWPSSASAARAALDLEGR